MLSNNQENSKQNKENIIDKVAEKITDLSKKYPDEQIFNLCGLVTPMMLKSMAYRSNEKFRQEHLDHCVGYTTSILNQLNEDLSPENNVVKVIDEGAKEMNKYRTNDIKKFANFAKSMEIGCIFKANKAMQLKYGEAQYRDFIIKAQQNYLNYHNNAKIFTKAYKDAQKDIQNQSSYK